MRLTATPSRVRLRRRGESVAPAPAPTAGPLTAACYAPFLQLHLAPDGFARPCCRSDRPIGDVRTESLLDIWRGEARRRLLDAVRADDYSAGCLDCGAEVQLEGRAGSYPENFDGWAPLLDPADPATWAWPRWMSFNLSNACNLQCVQCSGEFSSAIRIHREKRPPLPAAYGDRFFEELPLFLPHLTHAGFLGGEPFLCAENFRVWDLVAEHAPGLPCTVITNATQWTPRVERVLESVRPSLTLSLDGYTAATFEAIRVGADHAQVLANVERFLRYARDADREIDVNHCLMPQNAHEFADLLRWAEERDLYVRVSVVRGPVGCAIEHLPTARIRELHDTLLARDAEMVRVLDRNLGTWRTELARIGSWAGRTDEDQLDGWAHLARTILGFRRAGDRSHDDAAALDELRRLGTVHRIPVGPGDELLDVPTTLREVLGARAPRTGDPAHALTGAFEGYRELHRDADRFDAAARLGTRPVRIAVLAVRDEHGWADEGCILISIGEPEPS